MVKHTQTIRRLQLTILTILWGWCLKGSKKIKTKYQEEQISETVKII